MVLTEENKIALIGLFMKKAELTDAETKRYREYAQGGALFGALTALPNILRDGMNPAVATGAAARAAFGAASGLGTKATMKELGIEDTWLNAAGIGGVSAAVLQGLLGAHAGSKKGWSDDANINNAVKQGLANALSGGLSGAISGGATSGLADLMKYLQRDTKNSANT